MTTKQNKTPGWYVSNYSKSHLMKFANSVWFLKFGAAKNVVALVHHSFWPIIWWCVYGCIRVRRVLLLFVRCWWSRLVYILRTLSLSRDAHTRHFWLAQIPVAMFADLVFDSRSDSVRYFRWSCTIISRSSEENICAVSFFPAPPRPCQVSQC